MKVMTYSARFVVLTMCEMVSRNSRKKNWEKSEAGFNTYLRTNNKGRYVESYGRILNNVLWFHFDGKLYKKKPPQGYKWDTDKNGIRIVSLRNKEIDYHPTSSDLLKKHWYKVLREELEEK